MCKAKGYINQINAIFEQAENELKELSEQIRLIELEQQDLLHFIENESFNASRGYCLAKQLKDLRIKRHEIKNEWDLMQSFVAGYIQPDKQKIAKVDLKIHNKEKGLNNLRDNKIYHPRVLKEVV